MHRSVDERRRGIVHALDSDGLVIVLSNLLDDCGKVLGPETWCSVRGSGCGAHGMAFGVQGVRRMVWHSGLKVRGAWCCIRGEGCGVHVCSIPG